MKKIIVPLLLIVALASCHFDKNIIPKEKKNIAEKTSDTIRIANDSLQYEVIIIDPGFNYWLNSQAKPRNFYTQSYLEGKNRIYVAEWNNRVISNPRLYEMSIDYSPNINYGYEVNYLIYNYLIYFQIKNKQQLAGFVPRP